MPRPKGGKTRVEEEGAEHISTQDVEDAQLRATLAATHVDELRASLDCSRRLNGRHRGFIKIKQIRTTTKQNIITAN